MRFSVSFFATVLALGALIVSCGPRPKAALGEDPAAELSANELANLQDFHAWKLAIPKSQQPLSRVKLVLLRGDGTSVQLFGTAYSDTAPAWTNILLGFRFEGGRFSGRLHGRSSKMGETYSFSFTNTSTEHVRSWSGPTLWNGAHAELATFWISEEAAKRGGNDYITLAVELVK
jgi:hypothetical protein